MILLFLSEKKLPQDVDSSNVFVSNELDLGSVNVYGFDYDYTLANYEQGVEHLIYQLGRDNLINKYKASFMLLFQM